MLSFPSVFPELLTERLKLRAVHIPDAALVYALYSDPRVQHYRGEPVFQKKAEAGKLVFSWQKLFATQKGIRWGIEWKENDALIGTLGFKEILHQHRRAVTGYELDPAHWNKGIMTEALQAVCDFGFREMKFHSFEANITPGHLASQRVLEKLGFKAEALYRENFYYGHWWDSQIWSLINKS
jgi:[ribosomal protein S5]-alanine N-acetyltransferase